MVIPLIGFVVSTSILSNLNSKIDSEKYQITIEQVCKIAKKENNSSVVKDCSSIYNVVLNKNASIISGLIILILLTSYLVLSFLCGNSRAMISIVFPMLVPISLLIIACSVLAQGTILTYSAYIGESYLIGRVHVFLIGGIGIGALIASFSLLSVLFSTTNKKPNLVLGLLLDETKHKLLLERIKNIANQLKAKIPDNFIIGLEPTFYVTNANLKLIGSNKEINGETIYLSLPLMRILTNSEIDTIIGHELGHFIGNDLNYSTKFAPVYRRLYESLNKINNGNNIAAIPAISIINTMLDVFSKNEKKISRIRELEADKIGVSVSNVDDFAFALAKVAIYSSLWTKVLEENVLRLSKGKISKNLSEIFEDSTVYDVAHTDIKNLIELVLKTKIAHPTDTHPTIDERYKNIGFDSKKLNVKRITTKNNMKENKLFLNEEEKLTTIEHQLLVASGQVSIPEEKEENENVFLQYIYVIAASMIGADKKIEQSEIQMAEVIGKKLVKEFDSTDFRNCCKNFEKLPPFTDVIKILKSLLKEEHKTIIYKYLESIANADDDLAEEEKKLLDSVKTVWNLK